jgi:hypothetical protein
VAQKPSGWGRSTLAQNGQHDSVTPPDLGKLTAKTLRQADSYAYPGLGDGASLNPACPHTIAVAFLDNRTERPDAGCIKTMTTLQWGISGNE